jgi:hypothetical protein
MATKFVVVNTAKLDPGSLPCPGGDVDIAFQASSGHVLLRAQYVIVGSAPYRFAAGPEGARISEKRTSLTIDHTTKKGGKKFWYFSGPLEIVRSGSDCPGTLAALAIQVRVKEITSKGKISKTSRNAAGRIAILSAGLQQMMDAKGLSASQLSKKLAEKGKKVGTSAIKGALAGVKSSDKTNKILGAEVRRHLKL